MRLLEEENELREIVRLVGLESLSPQQRLVLRTAQSIREDFLHQNAFHEEDTYTSLHKQYALLRVILHLYEATGPALDEGAALDDVLGLPVWERIARARYIPEDELDRYDALLNEATEALAALHPSDASETALEEVPV
jgi:V/A-type H+-transporting ATPase subunit A